MDPHLQQRLLGAAILVALGVVFIPLLLDHGGSSSEAPQLREEIPEQPPEDFSSSVIPLNEEAIEALRSEALTPAPAIVREEPIAEELPDKDPNQGETVTTRTGLNAWVVQLGSFADEENAQRLVAKLKGAGHSAYVDQVADDGNAQFKVRVGPEITREQAAAVMAELERSFGTKGILLKYR
ncbi:MAG: SPOR domain-containing protein [Pseudomonadota bacterium]